MMPFTIDELACVTASRLIRDGETVFVGVGKPVVASFLAKLTHAPNATLVFETGVVRSRPCDLPRLLDTLATQDGSDLLGSAEYVNALAASGKVELGFLGAGQIDQFGNINSVAAGKYANPTVRWPGGGGANDIGTLCQRTVVLLDQNPLRLCKKVDFVTVPGHLDGSANARRNAGLRTAGPDRVVTNLAVFRMRSGRFVVDSIHPGVDPELLTTETGWDIGNLASAPTTSAPSDEELRLLRDVIDPNRIVLREPTVA